MTSSVGRTRRRTLAGLLFGVAAAALSISPAGCDDGGQRALIVADASGSPAAAGVDARAGEFKKQRGREVRVMRVPNGDAAVELASRGEVDVAIVPEAVGIDRFLASDHGTEAGIFTLGGSRLRALAVNPKQHPKADIKGAELAAFMVAQ